MHNWSLVAQVFVSEQYLGNCTGQLNSSSSPGLGLSLASVNITNMAFSIPHLLPPLRILVMRMEVYYLSYFRTGLMNLFKSSCSVEVQ